MEWKLAAKTWPGAPAATQHVISAACVASGGSMVLSFSRPLVTSDPAYPGIALNASISVVFAYGSSTSTSYHGSEKGIADINFSSGSSAAVPLPPLSPALLAHAAFMLLAWGLFLPAGAVVAKFRNSFNASWFKFHLGLQCAGAACVVLGFFLAVGGVAGSGGGSGGGHFNTPHKIIGLLVFLLVLQQVGSGAFRPHAPSDGALPSPTRRAWLTWHRAGALLVFLLACVNMFLGAAILLNVREFAGQATPYLALYILALAVVLGGVSWRMRAACLSSARGMPPGVPMSPLA